MNRETIPTEVRHAARNELEDEVVRLRREIKLVYDNLTSVQARCTELLEEKRTWNRSLDECSVACACDSGIDRLFALIETIRDVADDVLGLQPADAVPKELVRAIARAYHKERIARANIEVLFPGWTCANILCGAFNGTAKENLTECRACGEARAPQYVGGAVVESTLR